MRNIVLWLESYPCRGPTRDSVGRPIRYLIVYTIAPARDRRTLGRLRWVCYRIGCITQYNNKRALHEPQRPLIGRFWCKCKSNIHFAYIHTYLPKYLLSIVTARYRLSDLGLSTVYYCCMSSFVLNKDQLFCCLRQLIGKSVQYWLTYNNGFIYMSVAFSLCGRIIMSE